ncbi:MAG: FAD-dependent oxidoreductase [Thiobacillus sp.]
MTHSVWRGTAANDRASRRPRLSGRVEADVVIIGGGITGVTCAALLGLAGRRVVLLEARTLGFGTTGHSTGNLYEVLDAGLAGVEKKWGKDVVSRVAASRREAVGLVERFAAEIGETTAFRRCPLVQYSEDDWSQIEEEYETLRAAGVAVRFGECEELPGATGRALVIDGQAQFHPFNYVLGLAEWAAAHGVQIYEDSAAVEIAAGDALVRTASGSVKAKAIVVATHTPKGIYGLHGQMRTCRGYAAAYEFPSLTLPHGIFWQRGTVTRSFRKLEMEGRRYLITVGSPDKTGLHDPEKSLAAVESLFVRKVRAADERWAWSAQAYHSPDLLPYIGHSALHDVYIATGFGADGLTYGTLAAQILCDTIVGKDNRWADLYHAGRFAPLKSAKQTLAEQTAVLKGLIGDRLAVPDYTEASSIPPGSGAIVKTQGRNVALYRDPAGGLHAVSAACTHLGCIVHWNALEKSWDCPCHGSRFGTDGSVIEGPALATLEPVDLARSGDAEIG